MGISQPLGTPDNMIDNSNRNEKKANRQGMVHKKVISNGYQQLVEKLCTTN